MSTLNTKETGLNSGTCLQQDLGKQHCQVISIEPLIRQNFLLDNFLAFGWLVIPSSEWNVCPTQVY